MLLQPHHQGVHPAVEDDVGPLPAHLGGIAGGDILNVQGGTDHGAGNAQPLGAVALHLGPKHQLRRCRSHGRLNGEVVIADQGLQPQLRRQRSDLPGHLTAVGAQAHHFKTQFAAGDPCRGQGVGAIGEHKDPLARQIGGIHRAGIPRKPRAALGRTEAIGTGLQVLGQLQAEDAMQFTQELHRGANADWNRFDRWQAELALQPAADRSGDLGVEVEVGVRRRESQQVSRPGAEGGDNGHINAVTRQQLGQLPHVIAAAETQEGRPQQVHPRPAVFSAPTGGIELGLTGRRKLRFQQTADQLVEGLSRPPVFLFGIGRQVQIDHRDPTQIHARRQGPWLVLDQLRRAALAHEQCLRLKALDRIGNGALHQFGGVTP